MKLLLDTHIFLWFISSDGRLPKSLGDEISDPGNSVFLGVASNWEILVKYKLGKLPLPQSPEFYIPEQRQIHKIESLPITESSLSHLASLPDLHRDPFDRLLIAQTLERNMTIVTVDRAITAYNISVLKPGSPNS